MDIAGLILTAGLLLLSFVIYKFSNNRFEEKHIGWHRPWTSLLLALLCALLYGFIAGLILSWLSLDGFYSELVLAGVYLVLWIILKLIIHKTGFDHAILAFYRKLKKNEKALIWPYFYKGDVIKAKVGKSYFSLFFLSICLAIILFYIWTFFLRDKIIFVLNTSFLVLLIPFFLEYFIYLTTSVEEDVPESIGEPGEKPEIDFLKLWHLYIDTYTDGFSTGWYRNNHVDSEEIEKENEKVIRFLIDSYRKDNTDLIVSDLDLASSFYKLAPVLLDAINKGGNILVAVEIPEHFHVQPSQLKSNLTGREMSMMQAFCNQLSAQLQDQLPGSKEVIEFNLYDNDQSAEIFRKRIILTSVNNLMDNTILEKPWLQELKLMVILNFHDRGISNLFENREFNTLLNITNPRHSTLIITPYRLDLQPALEQTWLLNNVQERKLSNPVTSRRHFFIAFDFEKWHDNWNKIARAIPPHDVYSGLELVCPAIEMDVPVVNFMDISYNQVIEGAEEIKNYNAYISKFTITQSALNEKLFMQVLPLASSMNRQEFLILYDLENNAPKAHRKWLHLGRDENFSIVISKPHLFREYFNDNFAYFSGHPVEAIQPQLSRSRINLALLLLKLLSRGHVEEALLKEKMNQYMVLADEPLSETISNLFEEYFNYNIRDNFSLQTDFGTVFRKGEYTRVVSYFLNNSDTVESDPAFDFLDKIQVRDHAGNLLYEIMRDLAYQNYLPGQVHVFNGRPYQIDRIIEGGTLLVSKVNTSNALFYRPVRNVVIQSEPTQVIEPFWPRNLMRNGVSYNILFNFYETPCKVSTTGYYTFDRYYRDPEFSAETNINGFSAGECMQLERNYKSGRLLQIKWEVIPGFRDRIPVISKSLHLVLGEALQFFYPYHHQYLLLMSHPGGPEQGEMHSFCRWLFPGMEFGYEHTHGNQPVLELFLLEDANIDLGLIKSFVRNFEYILRHIFDYLLWLEEEPMNHQPGFAGYVCRDNPDKKAFLRYGGTQLPGYLDLTLLRDFIMHNYPLGEERWYELQKNRRKLPDTAYAECDFCRAEFKTGELLVLNDGRMRCTTCSDGAVDTKEAFDALHQQAKQLYRDHLGIDFSAFPYDALFVSATELHEKYGKPFHITMLYDVREAIGVAFDQANDFILVEDGYKPLRVLSTIIHEMGHIWQYQAIDNNRMTSDQDDQNLTEGSTVWAEWFLLGKAGHQPDAEEYLNSRMNSEDKYGDGIRYVMKVCPDNPFEYMRRKYSLS
ncbi:MAG: hypothetical protein NT040_10560 [Bacteroidetes bacterium]|nr:hypothetical protein [Bacteroidota bacterium]